MKFKNKKGEERVFAIIAVIKEFTKRAYVDNIEKGK